MSVARTMQRTAILSTTILIGSAAWLPTAPVQACEQAGAYTMKDESTHEQTRRKSQGMKNGMETGRQSTSSASASASASSRTSADGQGNCTTESRASAQARAGDQHRQQYDSDRQVSTDGSCRAKSESRASARTGSSSADSSDEPVQD
jgi:cytoskeletal protein RodZ